MSSYTCTLKRGSQQQSIAQGGLLSAAAALGLCKEPA
jgi:hypothetical protein